MKNKNLFPADIYTVVNQTILTEVDKKTIICLYEPIIGPIAVSLYLTLWSDLDKSEFKSKEFNHHHLLTILKANNSDEIVKARSSLEAVGLLKSYVKKSEDINEYIYELYSPLSANEFFNHPILSILLLNNIGEMEYHDLLMYYKKNTFSTTGYEEITSSMNETFKSVTNYQLNENIRRQTKLGVNLDEVIDFDLLISSIPKGFVNNKTFTKKNKELINQLAFIYNIDTLKMVEILRMVISDIGTIDKDKLRLTVRKNYEYNNNGSLPTIIYRSQPDYLKTPEGDLSNRGKMIYVFENTKPYDFLKSKNKGAKPTAKDLKLIEMLAVDFNLPAGVINVLIDYSLRVNDGKLNSSYLETVATDWSRKGIKTVPDAMDIITKKAKGKKTVSNSNTKKSYDNKNVVGTPAWMDTEQKSASMSEEELKELESLFEEAKVI